MIYNQSPLTVPTYITAGEQVNAAVVNRLVQNSGGLVTRVSEISNNVTVTSGNSNVTITANQDVLILCNNTSNITVTLPAASTQYKRITIKKTANNTATVTIQRAGSDTIEDPANPLSTPVATSYVLLTVDSSVTYVSSGNTWRVADLYISTIIVRAYTTNNQNVNPSAKIYFNATDINVGNFFTTGTSGTTSRFLPLRAGRFKVFSNLLFQSGTSTRMLAVIRKNGVLASEGAYSVSADFQGVVVSDTISFNGTTDYVEITGDTSGALRVIQGTQSSTYLTIEELK